MMTVEPLTDDDVAAWLPRHLRDPDGLLTSPEVCRMAGVTYRQLDYWIRQGWISPTVRATGSGSRRRFDPSTLRDITIIREFVTLLGNRQVHLAIDALNLWREAGRPDHRILVVAADGAYLSTPDGLLTDLRAGVACVALHPKDDL